MINYLESIFFQLLFNSQKFLQKILPFILDADAAARQVLGGWLQLHILLLCTASQCQIKGKPGKCQPSFDAFLPFSSYFPFPFSALVGAPKLHRTALDYPQSGSIQFLQWMSKDTHSAQWEAYFNFSDKNESCFLSISCFETRTIISFSLMHWTKISFFQDHASRQDKNFFLSVSGFQDENENRD